MICNENVAVVVVGDVVVVPVVVVDDDVVVVVDVDVVVVVVVVVVVIVVVAAVVRSAVVILAAVLVAAVVSLYLAFYKAYHHLQYLGLNVVPFHIPMFAFPFHISPHEDVFPACLTYPQEKRFSFATLAFVPRYSLRNPSKRK